MKKNKRTHTSPLGWWVTKESGQSPAPTAVYEPLYNLKIWYPTSPIHRLLTLALFGMVPHTSRYGTPYYKYTGAQSSLKRHGAPSPDMVPQITDNTSAPPDMVPHAQDLWFKCECK